MMHEQHAWTSEAVTREIYKRQDEMPRRVENCGRPVPGRHGPRPHARVPSAQEVAVGSMERGEAQIYPRPLETDNRLRRPTDAAMT